jgi:L-threonylcarbamoyladenylate synthase
MLNKYVEEVPELAWDIMDLSTKPTTIIYPKAKNLAKNAVAADGSIAIRMVKSGFCNRLIHAFGKPIISTSANISNLPAPIYVTEVADEIKNQVDLVIDIDTVAQTKPSAIIKLEMDGTIKVIRK